MTRMLVETVLLVVMLYVGVKGLAIWFEVFEFSLSLAADLYRYSDAADWYSCGSDEASGTEDVSVCVVVANACWTA